jgi:peptidoglycan hydrolase-like protein with peptidoglycan-binding domain
MKSSSDMKSDSAMKSGKSAGAAAAGGNAEQMKAVQQALKDKGHDPGEIDGKMGPKNQLALRDYQQKEGLKVTGRLDTETAAKLGVQAKAESTSSPAASPSGSSSSGASSSSPSGASSSASSPSGSSSSSTPSSAPAPSGTDTGAKPKK